MNRHYQALCYHRVCGDEKQFCSFTDPDLQRKQNTDFAENSEVNHCDLQILSKVPAVLTEKSSVKTNQTMTSNHGLFTPEVYLVSFEVNTLTHSTTIVNGHFTGIGNLFDSLHSDVYKGVYH